MVKRCLACGKHFVKGEPISYHRFPTVDVRLCREWLQALNLKGDFLRKYSFVCSKHFSDSCFTLHPINGKKVLIKRAVPRLYPYKPDHSSKLTKSNILTNLETQVSDPLQNDDSSSTVTAVESVNSFAPGDLNVETEQIQVLSSSSSIVTATELKHQLFNLSNEKEVLVTPAKNDSVLMWLQGCNLRMMTDDVSIQPTAKDVTPPIKHKSVEFLQEQDVISEQEMPIEKLVHDTTCNDALRDPLEEEPIQQPKLLTNTSNSNNNIPGETVSKNKFYWPRYMGDVTVQFLATTQGAKKGIAMAKKTIEKQARKIEMLEQEKQRLEKRLTTLKEIYKCLPKSELDRNTDTYILIV